MGDSGVVLGVGLVRAGRGGGGEFEVGLEDLDLAVILGVDACLSALVVVNGEVFDGRQGAGGAALLLQVLLDIAQQEAEREGEQAAEDDDHFAHFFWSGRINIIEVL